MRYVYLRLSYNNVLCDIRFLIVRKDLCVDCNDITYTLNILAEIYPLKVAASKSWYFILQHARKIFTSSSNYIHTHAYSCLYIRFFRSVLWKFLHISSYTYDDTMLMTSTDAHLSVIRLIVLWFCIFRLSLNCHLLFPHTHDCLSHDSDNASSLFCKHYHSRSLSAMRLLFTYYYTDKKHLTSAHSYSDRF